MFATPYSDSLNKVLSVPAPVGGLNARDSIVAMEPQDAIVMRNWWPQPYGCTVRKGYTLWSSGLGGTVHSAATLNNLDGSNRLFAWADAEFYEATTQGAIGAALYSGLAIEPWQWVQMVNAAGAFMIAVNGEDDAIYATGVTQGRIVAGNGTDPYTWKDLDPVDAVQVTVHQHRLWAVEKDTANGWFLPPDAVYGTFLKVDFGPLFPHGGYLVFLATWTMDDGNGAEDHLVGLSSEGDAVVFSGTDPEDDTKWALVGVYYLGAPVSGRRSYSKVGGDLIILTQQGAVSMTETLVSTKVENRASALRTAKIQFLISELTAAFSTNFGWQLSYFAALNMLMINVPASTSSENLQLASNQIINSWTQFTNMPAACWVDFENLPYFGDYEGNVWRAWSGSVDGTDFDGEGGDGIYAEVQQAYSYFGQSVSQKQLGMYRPNFVVDIPITFASNIVYDFATTPVGTPDSITPGGASIWNTALWNQNLWGGGSQVQRSWIQARGMGNAASIQLAVRATGEVLWVSTDYSYVAGWGIL